MKNLSYKLLFWLLPALLLVGLPACTLEDIENPNNPDQTSLENGGATINDLRLLAVGLESQLRIDMEHHFWTMSMVGREYWDLRQVDPRYTGEMLGANGAQLDNNGFLTTRANSAHYRIARMAWVLINATTNSRDAMTPAQKSGFLGFARTLLGYGLSLEVNRQFKNGIRIDLADPDKRGPFLSYEESLRGIRGILDQANTDLAAAGTDFTFATTIGKVARVKQFNRALAARTALYLGDKAGVRTLVAETWANPDGDMNDGVYYVFGGSGNDILNALFNVPDQTFYVAHPQFIAQAEAGDKRVKNKTAKFSMPVTADGLTGDVQVLMLASNTTPFPMIRNEELVLMLAEANIGTNNATAVSLINKVRAAAGLGAYAGATTDAALVDQTLKERRYSLFGEGHRWIDMRRYNRLGDIPKDRPGDVVHEQFPRPVLEE
jgi:starch-binding outer membrane protein, SusD/RagB family